MSQSNLYSPKKEQHKHEGTHTALQARSAPLFVKILVTGLNAQAQSVSNVTNNWNRAQNNAKNTKPYVIPNKSLTIGIPCLLSIETSGYTLSSSGTLVLCSCNSPHSWVSFHPYLHRIRTTKQKQNQLLSSSVSGACKFLFLIPDPSFASCMALGKSLQLPLHPLPLNKNGPTSISGISQGLNAPCLQPWKCPTPAVTQTRLVYVLNTAKPRHSKGTHNSGTQEKRDKKRKEKWGRGAE